MKLINTTSINDALLHQIIRYCQPSGVYLKDIKQFKFKSTKYYHHGCYFHNKRIVIHVPKPFTYTKPHVRSQSGGYLESTHYTWLEELIYLVAHEMRHMWQHNNQWKVPREAKRVRKHRMGTNASLTEVDACLYGIRKMRQYRNSSPNMAQGIPTYPPCGQMPV